MSDQPHSNVAIARYHISRAGRGLSTATDKTRPVAERVWYLASVILNLYAAKDRLDAEERKAKA